MLILIFSLIVGIVSGYLYYNRFGLMAEGIIVGFLFFIIVEILIRAVTHKKFPLFHKKGKLPMKKELSRDDGDV